MRHRIYLITTMYVLQVVLNKAKDRDDIYNKIAIVKPFWPNIEFVAIILRDWDNPVPPNPAPLAVSVAVGAPLSHRPRYGPYVEHWVPGAAFAAVQWHVVRWNHHLPLAHGAS